MTSVFRYAVRAGLLFGIWLLLSGKFDPLHVIPGAIASLAIAAEMGRGSVRSFPLLRFAGYVAWLLGQIVISNLRVARIVFSRNPAIAPRLLELPPPVRGDWELTVLGCSITLTPGTLTIDASSDGILVHALDEASARDVEEGVIAGRVTRLFRSTPLPGSGERGTEA